MSNTNYENIIHENEAIRSKVNVLEEELFMVNQQLDWLRKQVFGRKTEQTSAIMENEFGVQLSMLENDEKIKKKAEKTIIVPERYYCLGRR